MNVSIFVYDGANRQIRKVLNNMKTIILTSYLDFYEKDEQGNKIAHNFGNDNGILDCLKSNIKKYDNFVFVANGMEGEKAEAYFKLACNSFELTLPFNNYEFLCPSTKNRAKEMIEKADFIFLCGGHLPIQNKFFNDIGLKELLKNTNALIVGGSAGSMNCADVVYCPPELEEEVLDDNFNRYLKGLGLTNINIMPHFEEYQKMVICGKRYIDDIVVPDSHKIDIIALNNGSYIVIKDNQTTIYGESYLIRKGKITQINENQNTKHLVELSRTAKNTMPHTKRILERLESMAWKNKLGTLHKKPFADLRAEDIANVSVQLLPPDETVEIADYTELVNALNEVVTYGKDASYKEYSGQAVIYTITMNDGTEITVNAYNPFIIIDGIGYKTKYEPCERLSQIANELAK